MSVFLFLHSVKHKSGAVSGRCCNWATIVLYGVDDRDLLHNTNTDEAGLIWGSEAVLGNGAGLLLGVLEQ